jgi:hypothetical protein
MATLNKQPIFTSKPILVSQTIDAERITNSIWDIGAGPTPTSVFTAVDEIGSLIERITVSTCGDLGYGAISEKFVYLFIYDNNVAQWNLYKSAYIPAITITSTTLNHEIEWTFAGGLLLPDNFEIGFGASQNYINSGQRGDNLAITIEGSSYSQP